MKALGRRLAEGEKHDFLSLPLLVRGGTVLPVGACDTRPDYDYARDVELRAYGLGEGESFSLKIPTVQGTPDASYTVTRKDGKPEVSTDSAKPFRAVPID